MYDCSNICEDLMKIKPVVSRPVKIAVIGAGITTGIFEVFVGTVPGSDLGDLHRTAM